MSSDLIRYADAPLIPGDEVSMQTLWLSLAPYSWRSLAVLGASKGTPTLGAANSLARMAWWYTGQPSRVFDMRDLSLRVLEDQVREMSAQLRGEKRVFAALRSLSENATTAPLARAADGVVLCVELGKADIKSAQRAITAVGRDRFLGTILVSSSRAASSPTAPLRAAR
jgi:hypothetical protein